MISSIAVLGAELHETAIYLQSMGLLKIAYIVNIYEKLVAPQNL
jgi:hypothetical protein